MKTGRALRKLAFLCGLGLTFLASGGGKEAAAVNCLGDAPGCASASDCVTYCIQRTGSSAGASCNRIHCCVCRP